MLDVFKQLCSGYRDPQYDNILALLEALEADRMPFDVRYTTESVWYIAELNNITIVFVCTGSTVELRISGTTQFKYLFE